MFNRKQLPQQMALTSREGSTSQWGVRLGSDLPVWDSSHLSSEGMVLLSRGWHEDPPVMGSGFVNWEKHSFHFGLVVRLPGEDSNLELLYFFVLRWASSGSPSRAGPVIRSVSLWGALWPPVPLSVEDPSQNAESQRRRPCPPKRLSADMGISNLTTGSSHSRIVGVTHTLEGEVRMRSGGSGRSRTWAAGRNTKMGGTFRGICVNSGPED